MVNVDWSIIEAVHCFIQNVSGSLGGGMHSRKRAGIGSGEGRGWGARREEQETETGEQGLLF